MVLNFIGDVDSIRERQKEFVCEVLKKRGFKNCDVSIESMGTAGDNFIANVKRIVVNQNGTTFKMIAKLAPVLREMLDINILFRNEHIVYTEVFPKFRELQKSAGVPEKDWFRHAECYGTYIEAPNEVVLLEDLKETKFDILDRFKPMSNECVKLVLKNLAIFHSLSFVLKAQEPEKFAELTSNLFEVYDGSPEQIEMRLKFGKQIEDDVLAKISDETHKSAFKETIANMYGLLKELTEKEKDSPYSVIQQGDGWTNNIMFTFEDHQPSKCILIDYQMAKDRNPMYDVMYMIFNSTATEQRIKHYKEFIHYYHDELDKSLNNYGLEASKVYPKSQLDVDMKNNVKLILAISLIVTNLIVKDVEEASKLQETMKNATEMTEDTMLMMMEKNAKTEVLFQKRIAGLAKSVIELGLL